MSKKKFIEGIEDLFNDTKDNILSEESVLLSNSVEKKRSQQASRAAHGKDFSSDLEIFLKEAFEDSFDTHFQSESKQPVADLQIKKRNRKPFSGLDALIRSTLEPLAIEMEQSAVRRVTLLFDERKLDKLKTIARLERTYLKNIVDAIVEDYILSYEQKRGNLE